MSIYRFAAGVFALASVLFVCGCQPSGASSTTTPDQPKAIAITSGNGTTVLYMSSTDGTVRTMNSEGAGTCKKCEADVAEYFKTGHIDPTCSVCGAHRSVLAAASNSGHN